MRKNLLSLILLLSLSGFAQKRLLSYTPSNLPVFIDQSGDTLTKALLGGLNQPQFHALDINNDGKKDLFVYDRTGHVILPFINTGKNDITTYKYSPHYVSSFPKLKNDNKGTWVLFADYDNDGKDDMWASVEFKTVLYRNITKSSDKAVKFSKISPFLRAYKYSQTPGLDSVNVSASFFNIPTIGDVDGDGDIDIFSYQANEGNLLLYRNMTKDFNLPIHPPIFDLADLCWADFKDTAYDGVILRTCATNNRAYRKKHSAGSTLLWFDNDNDGDMDLLMGNGDGQNIIFLKNGKKEFNKTIDTMIAYDGRWPKGSTTVNLSSFPATFMLDANGDGVKDILVAPNQTEKTSKIEQTKQVLFYRNKGSNSFPDFKFEKKNFFTDEFLDHGDHTGPALHDIDNDQDLDLIIATNGDHAKTLDKAFRLVLYRNTGTKKNPVFKLEDEDLWGLSLDSLNSLNLAIGDLNGDGKPDLIAGDNTGAIHFYKNIGTSTTWAFTSPVRNYLNINVGPYSSPHLVDMDHDGKLDIVIGERSGNFNYYKNTGSRSVPKFIITDDTLGNFITNQRVPSTINNRDTMVYLSTGYASGTVADLDNDGKYDMVFGGEEGKIRVMKFDNISQKIFTEDTTVLFDSAYMRYATMDYGNNARPAIGDLDDDGVNDIIVGNNRGGISFLKGSVQILNVVNQHKRNEPIVYPNPVNGSLLNINKKTGEEFTFSIYDLTGKLIQTENSEAGTMIHSMSLDNIINGMYILQSTSKTNSNYYTRIIVSRS